MRRTAPHPCDPAARLSRGLAVPALALGLVLASALPLAATANEIEGVPFAERVVTDEVDLELRGLGLLRYRGLIKAYVGALYLERGTPISAVLDDVPKRLELEYFWALDGGDFGRAAERLLERSGVDTTALRTRLDDLHARYEDVEPGDRYALTYVPGRGTEVSKNGRPLAVIAGADFARAYFGIWLGPEPIDQAMRDQLLADTPARPEISRR